MTALAISCGNAHAQDSTTPATSSNDPTWEVWVGAEAAPHYWTLYSGITYAPFGGIGGDGLRLRSVAGYGRYGYDTHRWTGTSLVPIEVTATTKFADFLIGYQQGLGPLTVKAFAGLDTTGHWLSTEDPYTSVQGVASGFKIVAEGWMNWTESLWSSFDLSWSSLHDNRHARLRSGLRIAPGISVGLEGGYSAHANYDIGKAGLFVRSDWPAGELSISTGISADRDGAQGPYGTINWLIRY